jgi:hypothetical protein
VIFIILIDFHFEFRNNNNYNRLIKSKIYVDIFDNINLIIQDYKLISLLKMLKKLITQIKSESDKSTHKSNSNTAYIPKYSLS